MIDQKIETIKNWLKFVLPGYYLVHSRLIRMSEKISWIIVMPLAILLANILVVPEKWLLILSFFPLGLLGWLAIYELGYLTNDVFTIKREASPTLRTTGNEINWIRLNFPKIVYFRIILFGCISYILWQSFQQKWSFVFYASTILATQIVFYFHNQLRSRWNILTYFLLSTGKYLFLTLALFQFDFPLLLLTLIMTFPLPRTLEHACKVKYGLKSLKDFIGGFDLFRVKYYGVGTIFFGFISWRIPEVGWIGTTIIFGYFFIFRILIWMIIKYSNYQRTDFETHQWDKR